MQRFKDRPLNPYAHLEAKWQRFQSQKKALSLVVNINVEKYQYGKAFNSFHASLKLRSEIFAYSTEYFKILTKNMITLNNKFKGESRLSK